jgi:hypothetical protein
LKTKWIQVAVLKLDKGLCFENLVLFVEKHGCDRGIFCMMLFSAYLGLQLWELKMLTLAAWERNILMYAQKYSTYQIEDCDVLCILLSKWPFLNFCSPVTHLCSIYAECAI